MSTEADDIDRATTHTLEFTEAAVSEARRKAAPEQLQRPDGTWPITDCEDCSEPIEPRRLALARIRCVACQGTLEVQRWFSR